MEVWMSRMEVWKSVEVLPRVLLAASRAKLKKQVFRVRDSRRRHWYTIVLHKKATVGPSVGSVACLPRRQPIV